MATMQCPSCNCSFKKPTNVIGWILGILATFFIGGFLLIVVCLTAISAIGASADSEFSRVSQELTQDGQVQAEAIEYGSDYEQQVVLAE